MIVALLIACDGGLGTDGLLEPEIEPVDLAIQVAPAWDPLLESSLAVRFSADSAGAIQLQLADASGTVLVQQSLVVSTDGIADWSWTDLSGTVPPLGAYDLTGVFTRDDGEVADVAAEVEVIRLGFDAAWAEDDAGLTSHRIPLTWHQVGQTQDPATAFATLDALEEQGIALDFPESTPVLGRPLDGYAQPVAYTWDSLPLITVALGETAVVGEQSLSLKVDGWTVLTDGPLAPGQTVTLQRDEPLGIGPGLVDETLRLGFVVTDDQGTAHGVGAQFLPIRFYAVMDSPSFLEGGEVWPAAVEPLLEAIGGVTGDPEAVLSAMVTWIYNDLGLSYDTDWGASYYTAYVQNNWERGHFYFTDFLERRFGSTVNCSDCASILVSYANMIGVPLNYLIIGWNFRLNQIMAIGGDEFSNCPFGPGGCGFSYHAVTGGLDYELIWDATLALDGDENPSELPSETLMVQSISEGEYLDRLVKSGQVEYSYESQGTMQ
jgi:hypothetical protein